MQIDRLSAFFPLLQQGVGLETEVGCNIKDMLLHQFGISSEYIEDRIKTVLLDGKPVDQVESAIVRHGSHLALSAAMPGLAGAILRRGGCLASLRGEITHGRESPDMSRKRGMIVLKLFNLLLKELAPAFFRQGVWIAMDELKELLNAMPAEFWGGCKSISLNGELIALEEFRRMKWSENRDHIKLRVIESG
jgi:hypothetical protein